MNLGDILGGVLDGWRSDPGPDTPLDNLLRSDHRRRPQHRHRRDCRDITDGCYDLHCASCSLVVAGRRGPVCGECGHVWRTRWGLLFAHWRVHLGIVWQDWRDPMGPSLDLVIDAARTPLAPIPDWPRTRWWHSVYVFRCWRPGKVWVCPCCSHDL